jgi:hypothetical protein
MPQAGRQTFISEKTQALLQERLKVSEQTIAAWALRWSEVS